MNRKGWQSFVTGLVVVLSCAAFSLAQAPPAGGAAPGQPGGGQGQGGFQGGQGGRGFDPAQIRQTISNQYKEALGVTDEEWSVIGPKIDKISTLQADTGGGAMGALSLFARGMGRRGGQARAGGPGGGGRGFDMSAILGPETSIRRKMTALQAAIDNNASEADIRQLLASIREDREKARTEIAQIRKELIELLTQKQEAILFTMGILE